MGEFDTGIFRVTLVQSISPSLSTWVKYKLRSLVSGGFIGGCCAGVCGCLIVAGGVGWGAAGGLG